MDPLYQASAFPTAIVAVTHAGSFPGLHMIRELLRLKVHVRAVVSDQAEANDVSSAFCDAGSALHIHLVDRGWVPGHFDDVLRGATHLLHLVSPRTASFQGDVEHDMLKPAIEGSLSLLQSAMRVSDLEKVVLVSSLAALGDCDLTPSPGLTRQEVSNIQSVRDIDRLFAACNAMGERYCWRLWETWRCELRPPHLFAMTSLLPANICGPEVVPHALRDDNAKLFYAVQGNDPGDGIWGFWLDVRDVAIAACEALFTDVAVCNGNRYVLSAGQVSLSELSDVIRLEMNMPLSHANGGTHVRSPPSSPVSLPSSSDWFGAQGRSSDTADTSSEPASPLEAHRLPNLDVTPSMRDLDMVYRNVGASARKAFMQLKDTEWDIVVSNVERGKREGSDDDV